MKRRIYHGGHGVTRREEYHTEARRHGEIRRRSHTEAQRHGVKRIKELRDAYL